jgi:hypothetical protein
VSIESPAEAPDVEPSPSPPRNLLRFAAACVAATLGMEFTSGVIQVGFSVGGQRNDFVALVGYPTAATVIVSLVLLRFFPRRGWAAMLAAGALLTLPLPLSIVDPGMFDGAPVDLITMLIVIGSSLVLLGALGAAAWLSAAGAPTAGTVIAGVAVVMPIIGILAFFLSLRGSALIDARWLLIAFAVLGILGAAGALIISMVAAPWRHPVPVPSARVIAAGVLGAILPLLFVWFDQQDIARLFGEADVSPLFLLVLGLAMVVPAMLAALTGGWRLLAAAVGCGLVLAALLASAVYALLTRLATWQVLPALFGGLALGVLASASRHRVWFGAGALAVAALMLIAGPSGDGPTRRATTGASTLAMVLIIVGIAGAIAAVAAAVTLLTDSQQLPVALGSLSPALQTGSGAMLTYTIFKETGGSLQAGAVATASAIIGAVVVAVAIGLVTITLWQWRFRRAAPPADDGEAVWYQLPDDDPQ